MLKLIEALFAGLAFAAGITVKPTVKTARKPVVEHQPWLQDCYVYRGPVTPSK